MVTAAAGLALFSVLACGFWRLGRAAAWKECEALITDRLHANDDDAAAVLEAARKIVDTAAKGPYTLVLAHVWVRVANALR